MGTYMREVTLDQFVQHSDQLVEWVRRQHDRIVITLEGKVVARLEPAEQSETTIDMLRKAWGNEGRIGDVLSPVEAGWNVLG